MRPRQGGAPGPRRAEEDVLHAGHEHRLALGALVDVALHHVAVLARVHLCAARRPASCAAVDARPRGSARAQRAQPLLPAARVHAVCVPRAGLAVSRYVLALVPRHHVSRKAPASAHVSTSPCISTGHVCMHLMTLRLTSTGMPTPMLRTCICRGHKVRSAAHCGAPAQRTVGQGKAGLGKRATAQCGAPAQRTVGQVAAGRVAEARRVDDLAHEADALLRVRLLGAPLAVRHAAPPHRGACGRPA
jgi:hypothetical protein